MAVGARASIWAGAALAAWCAAESRAGASGPEAYDGTARALRDAVAWVLAVTAPRSGATTAPRAGLPDAPAGQRASLPVRQTREDMPGAGAQGGAAPFECITAMRPWGDWTPVTCHPGRSAPLPEGPIVHLVHSHPGGSSLSVSDLWVLVARPDIESVSATTADGGIFFAERGPNFGELTTAYPHVRAAVTFRRLQRAEREGVVHGDLSADVNAALAARGIICYRAGRVR